MKVYTLQESYDRYVTNQITKTEFQRLLNQSPLKGKVYSQSNTVEDVVQILKNKRFLTENVFQQPVQEIKRINQPGYKFYVLSVKQGKIVAGNEFVEDAKERASELSNLGPLKIVSFKALKTKYHLDPNENGSWGTDMSPDTDGTDELSEENDKVDSDINNLLKSVRESDSLKGGLSDNSNNMKIDTNELSLGISVELEHTSDPKIAAEIALDHLKENPKYYTNLSKSGIEEGLPDDYDDDLKAAGLAQEGELNELSSDTVIRTSNKMLQRGQDQRATKLIDTKFDKLVGVQLSPNTQISRVELAEEGNKFYIYCVVYENGKEKNTVLFYNIYKDLISQNGVPIDRKGQNILLKIVQYFKPNTQYKSGTHPHLKIQGY